MSPARKKGTDDAASTTTCPWCSATVPVEAATCPNCGATLRDAVDGDILGVTQVDIAATTRIARMAKPGRLATWLGAESTADNAELEGHLEEPSEEVRKEMLRLELAALDAELEAQRAAEEANRRLLLLENGEPVVEGGDGSAPPADALGASDVRDAVDAASAADAPEAPGSGAAAPSGETKPS